MATIAAPGRGRVVGRTARPGRRALGRAAGALAGYTLDQALIESTPPRSRDRGSTGVRAFTAEEGAPIPRVYGRRGSAAR